MDPLPVTQIAPSAAPRAVLEILSGSRCGAVVPLNPGVSRLGRAAECEIRFDASAEPLVSGLHAELRLGPAGAELRDLGSRNGTCLDGAPVTGAVPLYDGGRIELGSGGPQLAFRAPALARPAGLAAPSPSAAAAPVASSPWLAAGLFGAPLLLAGAFALLLVGGALLWLASRNAETRAEQERIAAEQRAAQDRLSQQEAGLAALGGHAIGVERNLRTIGRTTEKLDTEIGTLSRRSGALEQALALAQRENAARDAELARAIEELRRDHGVRLQSLEEGQKLTHERIDALKSELGGQIETLRKDLNEAQAAWKKGGGEEAGRELAVRLGPAVFVCAVRVAREGVVDGQKNPVPVGHLLCFGTAWGVDPAGRLATNAHVVKALIERLEALGALVEPVAVQNGTGRIFRLVRWTSHPGFENPATWNVCDVGLLFTAEPIPCAIPLASRDELHALGAGQAIFSMGFPIEVGASPALYSYFSPDRAIATLRCGWIQRITTADGRMAGADEMRLLHIGLPSVGGQSGSAVFTREGKAVALLNAGEMSGLTSAGARIPHSGLFTYAVRADALDGIR